MKAKITLLLIILLFTSIPYARAQRRTYGILLWNVNNAKIKNVETPFIWLRDSNNNTIFHNTVHGNEWWGILMQNSSYNTIIENHISNSQAGILVTHDSNYNSIERNTIINIYSHTPYGAINLYESTGNIIKGNNIENNYVAIGLINAQGNMIIHNNFVNNEINAYDWSQWMSFIAPSESLFFQNYWSDYIIKYPEAQEIKRLGIWDTAYGIDDYGLFWDNEPLVKPWNTRANGFRFHCTP